MSGTAKEATMANDGFGASSHRKIWRWRIAGMVAFVIVAAIVGYQVVQPFSDLVNDVLGRLSIGE
jgi:hypothetical protein